MAAKKKAAAKTKASADVEVNAGGDEASTVSADTTLSAELDLDAKTGVAPEAESDEDDEDRTGGILGSIGGSVTTAAEELGLDGDDEPDNPMEYNDNAEEKNASTLTKDDLNDILKTNQGGTGNVGQTEDQLNDIRNREDGRLLARDNYALGNGPRLYACVECYILVPVNTDGVVPLHYASPFSSEVCAASETTLEYAQEDR